ncbi:MFS transporter [Variovorax ureilyticus]|uniref:MFS transporter n=1 Tax=Variovorax ureilyticus TaxID=1836198 RepID=A0ABU8VEH3_9BURK
MAAERRGKRTHTGRFLTVQTLAGFSQWIDVFLIFSIPSFLWQASPARIALLAALFGIPSLFLGPFIGAFLDRIDPRRILYLGIFARSVLTAAIAFAPNYWSFAALTLLKGLANLCYWPASSIITNRLVGSNERVRYFSSLSALDQVSKIVTPLIAGALTLLLNSQVIFLFSACMTMVAAALLPRLLSKTGLHWKAPTSGEKHSPVRLRDILNLPRNLIVTIALSVGISLSLAVYDPHLARFLSHSGFNPRTFSIVVSSTGVGAVTGALLVRFFFANATVASLVRSGIGIFTIAITSAAVISSFYMEYAGVGTLVVLWLLNGLGYELFMIGSGVNLQNLCPVSMLGRVSTSVRSLQMLVVVTGPSIGAWLISAHSWSMPFVVAAAFAWLLLGLSITGLKANFSRPFGKAA